MTHPRSNFRNRALALAAGLAALLAAGPAAAQWFEPRRPYPAPIQPFEEGLDAPLTRREILRSLERRGLWPISPLRSTGDTWRVEVETRQGRAFALVIDALDGEILRRTPVEAGVASSRRERDDRFFDERPGEFRSPPGGFEDDGDVEIRRPAPSRSSRLDALPPREVPIPREPRAAPRDNPPRDAPARETRPREREPERRAARPEPPVRAPDAVRPPPRTPEPAPREVRRPEPKPADAKPPAAPSIAVPEVAEPEIKVPDIAKPEIPAPASSPVAADSSDAPGRRSVRVIEGVTPVLPQAEPRSEIGIEPPEPPAAPVID